MNYVVGGRSTDDDPLVWHLAGSLKSKSNAQGEKFLDRGLGVGAFPAKMEEKKVDGKVRFERCVFF